MEDKISIIKNVCELISEGKTTNARKLIAEGYRHVFVTYKKREMNEYEKLKIFIRDGFIDRYTGKRLLFPNVLRILSIELAEDFPFQKNWKMSDCHIAYWNHMPTYDHVVPIARGGEDVPNNIVTTSQIMNSAKTNFLIEELGWKLVLPGRIGEWDGMMNWYQEYRENYKGILEEQYIRKWDQALNKCIQANIV